MLDFLTSFILSAADERKDEDQLILARAIQIGAAVIVVGVIVVLFGTMG